MNQPFLRYCLCRRYPLMLVPKHDYIDSDIVRLLHYPWDSGLQGYWYFDETVQCYYFEETVQYDVEKLPAFWQNLLEHSSTRY
jgi:hypothetical protein